MTPHKTRVLVIDDEPQILRALRINLSVRGYEVLTAASGVEALRTAADHRPDVIVLDLGLPDMSGIEVLGGLRGWLTAPVIVLSARTDSSSRSTARASPAAAAGDCGPSLNSWEGSSRDEFPGCAAGSGAAAAGSGSAPEAGASLSVRLLMKAPLPDACRALLVFEGRGYRPEWPPESSNSFRYFEYI